MKKAFKTSLKFLGIALIGALVLSSCSKDDNPVDNDLFVGKYKGSISYLDDDTSINKEEGNVEVVKVGKNYNFIFSDKIPNLTGVHFKENGDNGVINIDSDEAKLVRIDASKLVIAYTKDGNIWTANCDR